MPNSPELGNDQELMALQDGNLNKIRIGNDEFEFRNNRSVKKVHTGRKYSGEL